MQNSSRNHLILASVFAMLFVTPGKTLKKKEMFYGYTEQGTVIPADSSIKSKCRDKNRKT